MKIITSGMQKDKKKKINKSHTCLRDIDKAWQSLVRKVLGRDGVFAMPLARFDSTKVLNF